MDPKVTKSLSVTGVCAVLICAFSLGRKCGVDEQEAIANQDLNERLTSLASSHDNTLREKQEKVRSLEELLSSTKGQLDDKTSEAAVLAELVKKLKSQPREVEVVVQVEKVYLPGAEVRIPVPSDLERHELVRWDDDTPVASVDISKGELVAKACQMEFKLREVHAKNDSSFLLFVRSGCDDTLRDSPITDVKVTRVDPEKPKLFSPRPGLGLTAGATIPEADPILGASLYLELLHPTKDLALITPQLTIGTVVAGGLNVIGYNIGEPLPLVDDLWLHLGGGYGAPLTFFDGDTPGVGKPTWGGWLTVGTQL